MTDKPIDGEVVAAETELELEAVPGQVIRRYSTRITVEIPTADLQHLDLTRPVTIHQEPTDG